MSDKITIVSKATHVKQALGSATEVTLTEASVVELGLGRESVKSAARQGNDLVVTTVQGEVIVIHAFFARLQDRDSDLVFNSNNSLWHWDFVDPASPGPGYGAIDSVDPLLVAQSPDISPAWGLLGLGALAVGGVAAAASGGGSGGGAPPSLTLDINVNPDGSVVISGHTSSPGALVHFHYPDGSVGLTTSDASGNYSSVLPIGQPSGQLTAGLDNGASVTVAYNDHVAPVAPTMTVLGHPDGHVTVSGHSEPGSTVAVTFSDGSHGTATTDASGNYTIESAAAQPDGTIDVHAVDASGNTSPDTQTNYTHLPAPTIAVTDEASGKPVHDGGFTDDATPTFSGHATPGSDIVIVEDGGTPVVIHVDPNGNGDWVYKPPVIPDGPHHFDISTIDPDGNVSPPTPFDIVIDTVPPIEVATIAGFIDAVAPITGTLTSSGSVTNDAAPTIVGTLSTPLAADESLQLLRDGVVIGTATVTASVSGTTWAFADSGLVDGHTYVYTVSVADAAGNVGATSQGFTISVDLTAPSTPTLIVTDDAGSVTGIVAAFSTTDDNTPTMSGTAAPNIALNLVIDGGAAVSVAVDGAGQWVYTAPVALADGPHTVSVAAAPDAAGNVGAPVATGFTVNTSGVATPTLTGVDDVGAVTGPIANGSVTDDAQPAFQGIADSGASVSISLDGGPAVIVTADGTGAWSYAVPVVLADGPHSVSVSQTNAVGTSGLSTLLFTVDTSRPAGLPSIVGFADDVGSVQGASQPSGTTTDDTTPVLNGTLSAALTANESLQILRDGVVLGLAQVSGLSWTYSDTGSVADTSNYIYGDTGNNVLTAGLGTSYSAATGAGNDTVLSNVNDFKQIDGGTGYDNLTFNGAMTIDFAKLAGRVTGIEQINLGTGNQTLKLGVNDVFNMSYETDDLKITGTAGDSVDVKEAIGSGSNAWHNMGTASGVTTYQYFDSTGAATTARLLIDSVVPVV